MSEESGAARTSDPRMMAAIVASALFMQNLDSSAVMTALPAMARDFGVEAARLSAAVTSYLVALTVFIPVSGWVADRFGAKRVFMAAIAVFGIASALCGQASGVAELVAFRVLQGMGGAMMVPVARLILLRRIRKEEMIQVMTWLTMPAMIGPISGPPVGGLLTDAFGWRSVFYLNVPIAVLGLALVAWKIPRVEPTHPGPPDVVGLLLTGVALALFMFGLETVGRGVLPDPLPELALLAGLAVGVAAVRHCRRVARPAVDFGLLKIPTFKASVLAGSVFRVGAGTIAFLVPMLLQLGFGKSASEAGLVSFASAVGALAMKPVARPILKRFGFRGVLSGNVLLVALGTAMGALFTPAWPLWLIFLLLAVAGLFRSLQFTALSTLAYCDIPNARLSAATSFFGTLQQLSPALGVVLASGTLELSAWLAGRHDLALRDFATAFIVSALVVASSGPSFLRLSRDAGVAVSGHRPEGTARRRDKPAE